MPNITTSFFGPKFRLLRTALSSRWTIENFQVITSTSCCSPWIDNRYSKISELRTSNSHKPPPLKTIDNYKYECPTHLLYTPELHLRDKRVTMLQIYSTLLFLDQIYSNHARVISYHDHQILLWCSQQDLKVVQIVTQELSCML